MTNYFISAIGGCISAIIFLVLWIKVYQEKSEKKTAALNEKHEEKIAELYKRHEERLAEMYKEGLKMTREMIDAINRNSDTIDKALKDNVTINDLHKILTALEKK